MPTHDEVVTQIRRGPLTVKAFGITDKGRVRPSNEDQFLIAELTKAMRIWQTSLAGTKSAVRRRTRTSVSGRRRHGRAPGAASRPAPWRSVAIEQFTLNTFKWFFRAEPTAKRSKSSRSSRRRFVRPTRASCEEAAEHPELRGMGTTVTMAYHLDAQLCVVHVGDSRAYSLRGRRTAPAHARPHADGGSGPQRRASTRRGRPTPASPCHHQRRRRQRRGRPRRSSRAGGPGRRSPAALLGRTDRDGANDEIAATLRAESDPEAACTKLLAQANDAGGGRTTSRC